MKRCFSSSRQLIEVTVKQGVLRGKKVAPPNGAPAFEAFLGVPYAKPPVGHLRLEPAQPPQPWEGVRQADSYGELCMQVDFYKRALVGAEDCLHVNIYRPCSTSSSSGDRKPVIFFLPYGMWNLCNPGMGEYGPEHLVAKDVIMVSVSYRLGALGFLSLNSPGMPGNLGIRDCLAALRWVKENIAAFGGDPARVTAMGVCVGGMACQSFQFIPSATGLFQQAIVMSGSVANQWASYLPGNTARHRTLQFAKMLGCDATDAEEIKEFMKKVPLLDLFSTSQKVLRPEITAFQRIRVAFAPSTDEGAEGCEGGQVMPAQPMDMLHEHRFSPVPTIFSFASQEGMMVLSHPEKWWEGLYPTESNLATLDSDLSVLIPCDLDVHIDSSERKSVGEEIRRLYCKDGKLTRENLREIFTDVFCVQGVVRGARYQGLHPSKTPTYISMFNVNGRMNRFSRLFAGLKEKSGVTDFELPRGVMHCDDVGYVFGSRPPVHADPPLEPGCLEAVSRRRLVALYTNFVKTGNPTPAEDPDVEGVAWKPLPNSLDKPFHVLEVGETLALKTDIMKDRIDFWQKLYSERYAFRK